MSRIALISTSDTDLLSARASGADYDYANPSRTVVAGDWAVEFADAGLIVFRVLGSVQAYAAEIGQLRALGRPLVVLGGEQLPDASLMAQSTVPLGVAAEAHRYLAQGGPENLRQLHAFLSDTVLLTGIGFEPPAEQPAWGVLARGNSTFPSLDQQNRAETGDSARLVMDLLSPAAARPATDSLTDAAGASTSAVDGSTGTAVGGSEGDRPRDDRNRPPAAELVRLAADVRRQDDRPRVGILFYRAQQTAGNTAYVHALADAIDEAGGIGEPIFATSLRDAPDDLIEHLGTLDALITTVLAAGGTKPAAASAGGDDEAWDVRKLAALDIPILQGLCLTWDRESWEGSDEGMSPLDVATQVAVPEFDGRIITVPFSFKQTDSDGLPHYVPDPERCRRVAQIAVNHARLRYVPAAERKIAIVLSAYPTKHSRIGNAVGLDTPVSVIRLLRALRAAGYDLGEPGDIPGTELDAPHAAATFLPTSGETGADSGEIGHIPPQVGRNATPSPAFLPTSGETTPEPGEIGRIPPQVGRNAAPGVGTSQAGVVAFEGEHPDTTAGNALIHALIAAGGQDPEWLTSGQLAGQPVRIPAATYRRWFAELPRDLQQGVTEAWGEAPGELFVDTSRDPQGEIVAATLQAGNVVILVQPPRGFGENPIAIYHDPDLAPSHHYLAVYRWIENEFGAHAVVHVGKHGNLEWLPGKTLGMSAGCGTDAALGSLPLIYPFLVNDPGEGTQAKRRAHATIVDHLIPPMARAESYGDIARLEQLLDEYGNVSVMDPAKVPALRGEIWTLIQAAQLQHDLGLADQPEDEEFDEFVMHVDGWLCEIKDVQIRDGLHVLGQAPAGDELINLTLAVLRASQMFDGQGKPVRGLRAALGLTEDSSSTDRDRIEAEARALVTAAAYADWAPSACAELVNRHLAGAPTSLTAELVNRHLAGAPTSLAAEPFPRTCDERAAFQPISGPSPHTCAETAPGPLNPADVEAALRFACTEVVPRLRRTTDEITAILHALDGGFVPAGPSGSPLRGLVNVLPTGRNFYSVDPKAIPSRLAYQTGTAMADSLLRRHLDETGSYPASVGLSVWGTSAMRTSGDDIAEVLALLGVVPVWDDASRRVVGLESIPLAELGRPRIDVTVRISGFFRDAFPHVVSMLDDAVRLVAGLDEPDDDNFVRRHTSADLAEHGDDRRATTRIFGSKPGSYGAGILPLIEAGNWRTDADLAEVYSTWGGYAYGRDLDGVPARGDMEANYRRIAVAAKNVDSHEHDIADSDDYFQYHGGMVATVRALTGADPKAYVGDSTRPDAVATRTLTEETARVFRARVVNPRWIAAMQRHGYKGAFELAATVDYLFGFDATAGVVTDWMYAQLANSYVLDEQNQAFMKHANPWALRGIIEKLGEAADRGLWAEPDPELVAQLQQVYLDVEGDLEDQSS